MKKETICVQSGWQPKNGEPRILPIYQSTTYKYETSEQMGRLFDLEESGYFYTRLQNPTNDYVASKICELEGGAAAMLTSSGQAANYYAVFNICEAGDHVVLSSTVYGGTFNLITVTMKKMGIACTVVDPDSSEEELAKAFRPNTKCVLAETIANPALVVLDIEVRQSGPRPSGAPDRGQYFCHAYQLQSFCMGSGHCHALHDQIHGRTRYDGGRRHCGFRQF